ncbi:hypothetical protein NSMM_280002 [Nitrosomonas mobilis]|uniref:Uncharacterized protein n=1 Tax=Nitrosomonas mobilis TaxID=51642 RepID=A0A1G5SCF8_9PROT|nr:hypothetical protein NSMM_280002 [Nitrosomonas mobilis]
MDCGIHSKLRAISPWFIGDRGYMLDSMVGITALTVGIIALLKYPKVVAALIVAYSLTVIFN